MAKTKVDLNGKTILVTGSPGFIGANLVLRLLGEMTAGTVISFDSMNDYYEDGLPMPPYAVYNIGGGQPENLRCFGTFICTLFF